ncbi:hypothetical protein [Maritalea porphyrae]|uniref:hypothetical protein n=1 Tax=Maritalea porphyrae TaxID=880732 RepID=UPI0022AF859A|nr:hypothetical protein [Maritalea porphyrae]MCZ4271341.1 hypothetical protein [Maritalea porphyrae]
MSKKSAAKSLFVGLLLIGSSAATAANFELKSSSAAEIGWSKKAECEAKASKACTSAYFCSNNIWMAEDAFDRVQDRRYAGEQLIIVKDSQPICAVN